LDSFFEKHDFIWLDENDMFIFVNQGIGKTQWGTFRRKINESMKRICSKDLPMADTKAEAQISLNRWAEKKGYRLLCVFGTRENCTKNVELCCRYCNIKYNCAVRCMKFLPCSREPVYLFFDKES